LGGVHRESLPALTGFEKLRKLEATAYILVGRKDYSAAVMGDEMISREQNLPEALERLIVTNCAEEVWQTAEVLFDERKQGGLKILKKVTLLFQKCGVAYWREGLGA
jgi:hypothetical protein